MKIFYSPKYEVDLGRHVFSTSKFRLVKEKLISNGIISESELIEPDIPSEEIILLVHTKKYFEKIKNIRLNLFELMKLEIPLTEEIFIASMICVQGTILAARSSLENKVGIHIGGGFHHAYPDHGEGFCIFNDLAIAVRYLQKENLIKKAAIVDCDLHQGNGTAYIFKNDKSVFTFSIHEEDIYPYPKEKSSLDINLPPFTRDEEYLSKLEYGLEIVRDFNPEIVIYQAGADPFENDILGSLKLTKNGLKKRDELVKTIFKDIPVVITLGGGYAQDLMDTVEIHYNTICTFLRSNLSDFYNSA